ncbi:hypothetical protein TNCV_4611421 [Trichonephila clavipes]|nr:hypothetical protein TNCV_4611421 [Trichonephila clavipes]
MLRVFYYELLQRIETITEELYQQQLMHLSPSLKLKRQQYAKRHDKVIFQHATFAHVAKVVKEILEALGCLTQFDVFIRHCIFQLSFVPIDDSQQGTVALHFLRKKLNIRSILGSPQKTRNVFYTESGKMGKVISITRNGQYFE